MVGNKSIIVRVTKTQHERIKNDAHAKGFTTIASYIRSLALERDSHFEQKFDKLYNTFIEKESKDKIRDRSLKAYI